MTTSLRRLEVAAAVVALRVELESLADPAYEAGLRRVVPSQQPAHFVRVPELRRMASTWRPEHRDASPGNVIELAQALLSTGWREEAILAMFILSRSTEALETLAWSSVEAWSACFENWEQVDNMAMAVTGKMLALRPDLAYDLAVLAGSAQPWQRRLAIVTLIEATRKDRRWRPQLEEVAARLTGDRGPTMPRAFVWARKVLRETGEAVGG